MFFLLNLVKFLMLVGLWFIKLVVIIIVLVEIILLFFNIIFCNKGLICLIEIILVFLNLVLKVIVWEYKVFESLNLFIFLNFS